MIYIVLYSNYSLPTFFGRLLYNTSILLIHIHHIGMGNKLKCRDHPVLVRKWNVRCQNFSKCTPLAYKIKPFFRGGAGISKVVRPLHIKDDLCMCKEGGGGGGLQQVMCR